MIRQSILDELEPYQAQLVAVTKQRSVASILDLYAKGQRDFGENRVQELLLKQPQLPADIRWHLIGHLQTNKVKYITPFIHLIHSVDSGKLLKSIDKAAEKAGRTIDLLLQFKIAAEDSKYGFDIPEAEAVLASQTFRHCRIKGVMGMATFTYDEEQLIMEFRQLKAIFDQLKAQFFSTDPNFKDISMGMSGDYLLALKEGSTMVRIGSKLFEG